MSVLWKKQRSESGTFCVGGHKKPEAWVLRGVSGGSEITCDTLDVREGGRGAWRWAQQNTGEPLDADNDVAAAT
jgi:hypothetical protein